MWETQIENLEFILMYNFGFNMIKYMQGLKRDQCRGSGFQGF